MAFIKQQIRGFSYSGIAAIDTGQNGVYGIFNPSKWIYVGKSSDIRKRLLEHLNGDIPAILNNIPTGFVGEVFHEDPSSREKELILELSPCCNQKVG